jgi:hypothetical protein
MNNELPLDIAMTFCSISLLASIVPDSNCKIHEKTSALSIGTENKLTDIAEEFGPEKAILPASIVSFRPSTNELAQHQADIRLARMFIEISASGKNDS